jgi:hypothetical protein
VVAQWLKGYLRGRQVDCVGHACDRYDRLLAVCYAGGESINDRLVREGWALDYRKYSSDYLAAEASPDMASLYLLRPPSSVRSNTSTWPAERMIKTAGRAAGSPVPGSCRSGAAFEYR